jgi:hypothetical protein
MLKFLPKLLAFFGWDRLDIFRSAPGLVEDEGNRADTLCVLLQASVPLEDLLLRPVVLWDV